MKEVLNSILKKEALNSILKKEALNFILKKEALNFILKKEALNSILVKKALELDSGEENVGTLFWKRKLFLHKKNKPNSIRNLTCL